MTETKNAPNYVTYSSINEDIDRIEAVLQSLGEELKTLKAKQQEIRHNFEFDANELLDCRNSYKRKKLCHGSDYSMRKKKKQHETAVEEIIEEDDKPPQKVTETEEDKTVALCKDQTKKKRKKNITEENYSDSSSSKDTISLHITDLECLNLPERIEKSETMPSEITEQKYEVKYTQSYSPQKCNNFNTETKNAESIPQCSSWRKEKLTLKDKLKNGVLRLDFHGSNIAKIPGYGERVHLNELY